MATLSPPETVSLPDEDGKERTYQIAGMGPAVRTNFGRVLKYRAWADLDSQRSLVDAARFARMEAHLTVAMSARKYEWAGPIHAEIANDQSGISAELLARLLVMHPEADDNLVERIIAKYGWDRIVRLMEQADGPPPKKSVPPSPDATPDQTGTPE